jgi:hypothetical protein
VAQAAVAQRLGGLTAEGSDLAAAFAHHVGEAREVGVEEIKVSLPGGLYLELALIDAANGYTHATADTEPPPEPARPMTVPEARALVERRTLRATPRREGGD